MIVSYYLFTKTRVMKKIASVFFLASLVLFCTNSCRRVPGAPQKQSEQAVEQVPFDTTTFTRDGKPISYEEAMSVMMSAEDLETDTAQ